MLTLVIEGDQTKVGFHYGLDEHQRRIVTCTIRKTPGVPVVAAVGHVAATYTVVAKATAACAPGDTFKKDAGRKLALSRAMAAAGICEGCRRKIWGEYHEKRRDTNALKAGGFTYERHAAL